MGIVSEEKETSKSRRSIIRALSICSITHLYRNFALQLIAVMSFLFLMSIDRVCTLISESLIIDTSNINSFWNRRKYIMNDSIYLNLLNSNLYNIYEGMISFKNESGHHSIFGQLVLHNSPYPQIKLISNKPIILNESVTSFPYNYEIHTENNHIFNVNGSEILFTEEEENIAQEISISFDNIKLEDTIVDEVLIFVMNCSHIGQIFKGESEYNFEYDDWVIDIRFRPDKNIQNHIENLRSRRGYDITHVGTIFKKNKESFLTTDISTLIKKLEWYLSFGSAQSVIIPIQIGYKNKLKVWENFVIKTSDISHFQNNYGWVPIGAVEDFNISFPQVASKLNEEIWGNTLDIVLSWYLEIKRDGMLENKIISTQIALEQLAWTYLVNQEQILDKDAFKKLRTTDILKLLCYQLKIPRDIAFDYKEKLLKKYNNDGAFMFVDFRNNLVHPDKKGSTLYSDTDSLYGAFSQGLFFLEKSILNICNYEGNYRIIK